MSKRRFRAKGPEPRMPDYPELDQGRRSFLVKLGGALLGAGALAACGDRVVSATSDSGGPGQGDLGGPSGVAPMPDAGLDGEIAPEPDLMVDPPDGVAPAPDAQLDKLDMGTLGGAPLPPDAQLDTQAPEPSPGFAPLPDAALDGGGSCPNP